jgi:hypothetical protein
MIRTSHHWPFLALAVGYVVMSLIHLLAALLLIFVFGAKNGVGFQPDLLPIYGWLGTLGYIIFFATIPLDWIAAVCLLRSRSRDRTVTLATAILNLPLIPLGTLIGACTLVLHSVVSGSPIDSTPGRGSRG